MGDLLERGAAPLANLVIFLAYFCIPLQLLHSLKRAGGRRAVPPHVQRLVALFAAFILLCGLSHFLRLVGGVSETLEAAVLWATAVVSAATAAVFHAVSFQAVSLPAENYRLERTVAELCTKKAEAEEARATLADFIGFLCHEIRNPLHAVMGLSDMLHVHLRGLEDEAGSEDGDAGDSGSGGGGGGGGGEAASSASSPAAGRAPLRDGTAEDMLSSVRLACGMMQTVLDDSLDLSKMRSGHLTMEELPFDCAAALHNTLQCFTGRAEAAVVRLTLDTSALPPATSRVVGDPTRVCQVLTNLVSNALKFTPPGGRVHVAAAAMPPPRGSSAALADRQWVRIDVADTGCGIPPEAQARLFKPFAQAHASTARQFGGTGLGLSICRSICELTGGTISLKSTEGAGTTFTVMLPLRRGGGADSASPRMPSRKDLESGRARGNGYDDGDGDGDDDVEIGAALVHDSSSATIELREVLGQGSSASGLAAGESVLTLVAGPVRALVVDDDSLVRRVSKFLVENAGCVAHEATSGDAAIEQYCGGDVAIDECLDLVLVDLHMPGADGFEVAQRFRASGYTGAMYACTGGTGSADRDRQLVEEAGFDGMLYKPMGRKVMNETVDKVCRATGRSRGTL